VLLCVVPSRSRTTQNSAVTGRYIPARAGLLAVAIVAIGCGPSRTILDAQNHSGMGPGTWRRFNKIIAALQGCEVITQATVQGGGYDIKLHGPSAELIEPLLLQAPDMADPDGPVHVSVRLVAVFGGKLIRRTLTIGFDPKQGRYKLSGPGDLTDLQTAAHKNITDQRLVDIDRLLVQTFDTGECKIDSFQVALADGGTNRYDRPQDILRLLNDLRGIKSEQVFPGQAKRDIKLTLSYTESEKAKTLDLDFSTNEVICRADPYQKVSLSGLAQRLKQSQVPTWSTLTGIR